MDVDSNNENGDIENKENTDNSNKTESKRNGDIRYDVELTRAIKENHGYQIVDARICPFEGGEPYFATIGSNQVKDFFFFYCNRFCG